MKIAMVFLSGLLACGVALAHPDGDSGDGSSRGGPPMERMAERLGLDDYQSQQVGEILGEARTKGMAIMMAAREETRAKMDVVHAETLEQLRTVLSEEQVQEFEALSQRLRERGFGPRGLRGPHRRGGRHKAPADDPGT